MVGKRDLLRGRRACETTRQDGKPGHGFSLGLRHSHPPWEWLGLGSSSATSPSSLPVQDLGGSRRWPKYLEFLGESRDGPADGTAFSVSLPLKQINLLGSKKSVIKG